MTDEVTLNSWLEGHVGGWNTDPPSHCMSDFYYPTHTDSFSYPKPPRFLQTGLLLGRDDDWPTKPKGLGTRPEDIRSFEEIGEKQTELSLDLHDRFITRLKGEDCREDYLYLLKRRDEFRDLAEKLASKIDDEYCIGGEEGGESKNVLEEAARFLIDLETAVQDFNAEEDTLEDAFKGSLETIEWGVSDRMGEVTSLMANSKDANDPIFQLAQPQMRSCLDLNDAGYKCRIDYLPADSSLKSIARLFRSHFEELEAEVNRVCNTQALYCYKLQVLQWVLRQYAACESPNTFAQNVVERRAGRSLPDCLTGKGYSMDVERLLDAIHGYVTGDDADSAWSSYGELDAVDVYEYLEENEEEALRKSSGGTVSENTLRRWLRKVPDEFKREWCSQSNFDR